MISACICFKSWNNGYSYLLEKAAAWLIAKMFIEHHQILRQNTSEKCKILFIIAEEKNPTDKPTKVASSNIWKMGNTKIKVISENLVWLLGLHVFQRTLQLGLVISGEGTAATVQKLFLYQYIQWRLNTQRWQSPLWQCEFAKNLNSLVPKSFLLTKIRCLKTCDKTWCWKYPSCCIHYTNEQHNVQQCHWHWLVALWHSSLVSIWF